MDGLDRNSTLLAFCRSSVVSFGIGQPYTGRVAPSSCLTGCGDGYEKV